jgi:exopolysaccharide production protein ExoQ
MAPSVALLLYCIGIAGLFYLDRDKSIRTSRALWLPVIWLWIIGSRPISTWMGSSPENDAALQAVQLEGTPTDRLIFLILAAAGIIVIVRRAKQTRDLLVTIWPILIFFSYCLVSVFWSDFPDVAAKRWIKATGDLVMVIIVVTDAQPLAALKRFFSRTGFILLPASLLLIKYFPDLGRSYDPWFGHVSQTGVTPGKNALGVITLVLSLAAAWQVITLLRYPKMPCRRRHLLAQGTLLAFGVALLTTANSATSLACFIVGTALMLATGLRVIRRRPGNVHALMLALCITAGLVMILGGEKTVVQTLGRNTTLTGRTDIWKLVLPMAPNFFGGAGFESFWIGPRLEKVWDALPNLHVNEAHDGYLEVYLNVGAVGLSLIVLVFIHGYRRCVATFRSNPTLGSLLLAYLMVAVLYNVTEAGFRMLNPMWTFLLLAIVASGGIAPVSSANRRPPRQAPADWAPQLAARDSAATQALVGSNQYYDRPEYRIQ